MFVETDAVRGKQSVLPAVEAALGVAWGEVRRRKLVGRLVDVPGADVFAEIRPGVHGAAERAGAKGQLVIERAGGEQTGHRGLDFVVAPGVIGAAEIVDVVAAARREVPRQRLCGAVALEITAIGEGAVVVDDHATAGGAEAGFPAIGETVFITAVHVQRIDAHRVRAALVAQQFAWRGVMGQFGAAQQLVARDRALLFGLVFDVKLQGGLIVDVPVERQRGEIALAIGVFDVGTNVLVGDVGAQPELFLAAKPAADVGGDVALAMLVGRDRHRPHVFRALGFVIDHARRLRHPALQPREAFEQFDLFFVFQRHVLLAGDAAAVDAITVGGVEGEATHDEILVIPHRRIAVAHRGVIAQYVAEQFGLLVLQPFGVEYRNRRRRVAQRRLAETANRCAAGLINRFLLTRHPERVQRHRFSFLGRQPRRSEGDTQRQQPTRETGSRTGRDDHRRAIPGISSRAAKNAGQFGGASCTFCADFLQLQ